MAAITPSRSRLRRLAEFHPEHGQVLSFFIDLDPREFATAEARASQVSSLVDEAHKIVEAADLDRDDREAARADLARVREAFDPQSMGQGGARGMAVFVCGAADLFEVIRTPFPLETRVTVDTKAHIEQLARAGERERWCAILMSAGASRVFLGDEDGLEEIDHPADGDLLGLLKAHPFDRLAIGGAERGDLHPYVAERLAGQFTIDAAAASADAVLSAVAPVIEAHRHDHEQEVIGRLRQSVGRGDGKAATGREDTRAALEQRRVEVLLLEPRVEAEEEIELAIDQDAEVLVLRDSPDLGPVGGIAAVLRF